MENLRDPNKLPEIAPPTKKKTTMPTEIFEGEAQERKHELLELLRVRKDNPLKLLVVFIYKDKDSYCRGDYREKEFYNNKNELIATYKENPDGYNYFVGGYLKALNDNGVQYELNEEACVD